MRLTYLDGARLAVEALHHFADLLRSSLNGLSAAGGTYALDLFPCVYCLLENDPRVEGFQQWLLSRTGLRRKRVAMRDFNIYGVRILENKSFSAYGAWFLHAHCCCILFD